MKSDQLFEVYQRLRDANGCLNWWPGRTRLEIIIGAILTQNTAWTNVEKALQNLKTEPCLNLAALRSIPEDDLARIIRPSGAFRQKARKLKSFVQFMDESYEGSLRRMARTDTSKLRGELLSIWGIGPETADSILLYAFDRPVFVVDTYTKRVTTRHKWAPGSIGYPDLQNFFMNRLPSDIELYNDFHAQIVWLGKNYCKAKPSCVGCPLEDLLPGVARNIKGGRNNV
ncbi:MAG: endonuclease III domain-containing protein [Candidatus Eisenbacteria bacterium]|uniref:Endonuclease III domain-containing protein n=1 Tax=Eiseniibacteriota bacterium TaxID=2212470 RepID=A0A948RT96_UNCEI|nr:endonuclease III domain-containing protein [Candidatus Eisenbacteria bacterium]MBU1950772.1 endonuclease III domain-containing protein [Candidatus Eisenbacteria bacterium]MBU2690156.1 endonuclease III domain-containing protein [Candidatus Eisenbacteria bacterium]